MPDSPAGNAMMERPYRGSDIGQVTRGPISKAPERVQTLIEDTIDRVQRSNERIYTAASDLRGLLDQRLGPQPPSPSSGAAQPSDVNPFTALRLSELVRDTGVLITLIEEQIQRVREL